MFYFASRACDLGNVGSGPQPKRLFRPAAHKEVSFFPAAISYTGSCSYHRTKSTLYYSGTWAVSSISQDGHLASKQNTMTLHQHIKSSWLSNQTYLVFTIAVLSTLSTKADDVEQSPLPGTAILNVETDLPSQMVDQADRFLLHQITHAAHLRAQRWSDNFSSVQAYESSLVPHRTRLAHLLGLHDARLPATGFQQLATTEKSALIAQGNRYAVHAIRWPAFGDVHGEGLLLIPTERAPIADVVVIPHADFTPEQLCGLADGLSENAQFARRLVESGCRVVIPFLINRSEWKHGITYREWLHRAAYELGRTMTGYEVQKVLCAADQLQANDESHRPLGIFGWGDGGRIALYAGAVDSRFDVIGVSGAFGDLDQLWKQPADRMVFATVSEFGDEGLATLIAPRHLIVEANTGPQETGRRQQGGRGAPYEFVNPSVEHVENMAAKSRKLVAKLHAADWLTVFHSPSPGGRSTLRYFLRALTDKAVLAEPGDVPRRLPDGISVTSRLTRQAHELDRHTQDLLRKSHFVRHDRFWSKLDTSSLAAYEASVKPFRTEFHNEVIGNFDIRLLPPNPRSRWVESTPQWNRYEVVLDVFDGVFAYGLLTIPKHMKPHERRPVVVCQHGLEGRPQSLIADERYQYYKAYATQLAERGFITFAPQNPYLFKDRFRTLQRKANSLGKTLFALITPQHQQIVDWLQTLPFVDADRIAFYGMSYGGKAAMRLTPLVQDYCLTITAGDFTDWIDKNASTLNPRSYVGTFEYEVFEWNLGNTFSYAEMAALIAPRPFMVERGHSDFVSDDWNVAWEYARVRTLYNAKLKIPDRTTIEWFVGGHTVNLKGSLEFLHKHLDFPNPR